MKSNKKYYSIKEVSKMLKIKEHVIRHWDSIDPKTKKLRVENLSMRTKGGTRFFNKMHIKNISNLISILQDNGKRIYSLDLASKILDQNKSNIKNINLSDTHYKESNLNHSVNTTDKYIKIKKVINNLKKLL